MNSSPAQNHGLSRRALLKLAAVGVAGAALGGGGATLATHLGKAAPSPYRFFTVEEAALLIGICEQLIPRDDTPGATDAGVIHYIDRQLTGKLRRHQGAYRRGLGSFARACIAESGAPFLELPAEKKIETLQRVEAGRSAKAHWEDSAPREFFRLVLAHTMQGFYGPSRHGGNRDHVSFKMLDLDYPQVIGQNRYRPEGAS